VRQVQCGGRRGAVVGAVAQANSGAVAQAVTSRFMDDVQRGDGDPACQTGSKVRGQSIDRRS